MSGDIVQVVHTRYTDEGCNIEVFLNGRKIQATVEDVDPGRGYSKREWARRVKQAEKEAIDFPTEYTVAVAEALATSAENQYLTDDDVEHDASDGCTIFDGDTVLLRKTEQVDVTEEVQARHLDEGDVFRDFGSNDWLTALEVDQVGADVHVITEENA